MILFVGVPDWKDCLPVCHALPQSVSFQVQLVEKMSSQGKYPCMITLLECKLKKTLPVFYVVKFYMYIMNKYLCVFQGNKSDVKGKNRLNKTPNEIKSDILISINR